MAARRRPLLRRRRAPWRGAVADTERATPSSEGTRGDRLRREASVLALVLPRSAQVSRHPTRVAHRWSSPPLWLSISIRVGLHAHSVLLPSIPDRMFLLRRCS